MTNPPYIVTRQMLANRIVKQLKHAYSGGRNAEVEEIYKKLVALGETPTPEQLDSVIGSDSTQTRLICNQCNRQVDGVVVVGQIEDYESQTASLCITCLEQAYKLAQGQARER